MSFTESTGSSSEKLVSLLWGCELSKQKDSYTFQMPDEWHCRQQLALHTICLGETAPDEFHMVEVVAEEGDAHTPVPLAMLKPSVLPMTTLAGMELTPPVTFHLRTGSGPVYISGLHFSMMSSDEEEEEEEEEEPEEPAEESHQKPPKGQTAWKGNSAKRRKLEKEDEPKKDSPEKPLPSKGRGAGQSRKTAPKK